MKIKYVKCFQPLPLPNNKYERYIDPKIHKVDIEFVNGLIVVTDPTNGKEVAFGLAQVEYIIAMDGESFKTDGNRTTVAERTSYKKKEKSDSGHSC